MSSALATLAARCEGDYSLERLLRVLLELEEERAAAHGFVYVQVRTWTQAGNLYTWAQMHQARAEHAALVDVIEAAWAITGAVSIGPHVAPYLRPGGRQKRESVRSAWYALTGTTQNYIPYDQPERGCF